MRTDVAVAKAAATAGGIPFVARLEAKDERLYYSVEVAVGAKTMEVDLDAKTGGVLAKSTEPEDSSKVVMASKISLIQALDIAATKTPGKAVSAVIEMKDGRARATVSTFGQGKLVDLTIDGVTGAVLVAEPAKSGAAQGKDDHLFTDAFGEDDKDLVSTGTNPFFILEPGWVIELKGGAGAKETVVTITVLDETKKIAGVEARAVEEKEVVDGKVKEITRDYYAISKRTNNVYYLGEDVDEYTDGKITGHGGSWLAGENHARYGLFMPGTPLIGSRFAREVAPGVAMARCEIRRLDAMIEAPAGKLDNLLETLETSAIEKGASKTKHHARGIGVVHDGECKLVRYGKTKK